MKICLNMIVKDERPVIVRCLASAKNLIDYWVIVDTGSSDGTQKLIREMFKDIPGELHERPWVNFAHNRNEALELAKNKADYLLFLDADEYLVIDDDFKMPRLNLDVYYVPIVSDAETFYRELMVKASLDWKWVGVLHEAIVSKEAKSAKVLTSISRVITAEGRRSSQSDKYRKDAEILEKELEKDPTDARNQFYLAVTYALDKKYDMAIEAYEKLIRMGGDPEDIFTAKLSIAEFQEILGMEAEGFIKSYLDAFQFRPTRAEPLWCLARYFINLDNPLMGYLLTKYALGIPYPQDLKVVRRSVYEYELLMLFAQSSYALGRMQETCAAYEKLIDQFEDYLDKKRISYEMQKTLSELLPGMKVFLKQYSNGELQESE